MIKWRSWGAEAFAEAASADKPILLNLTAVWCHWCRMMDETTYAESDLIQLINDNLIPIRVDADQHPHVQDRYIAGGWPTNAFLTPTGEVLWSGTYVPPEQLREVAAGVLGAWGERREELKTEIERRRKALEAARGRYHNVGLVRREAADDVLSATIDSYDDRNGGFGTEPKFPYVEAVEMLIAQGDENPDYLRMAEHTLDGMIAGELWDRAKGGFYRYALAADWTHAREEKLLGVNAAMLRVYALAGHVQKREEWRTIAEQTVAWVDGTLALESGLWAGSDVTTDDVVYTNYNAQWIRALALSGARFGKQDWVSSAQRALDTLLDTMSAPNDLMFHYRAKDGRPHIGFLLADAVDTARACLAVAQSSGDVKYSDHARRLAAGMERAFWAEDGGYWERAKGHDEIGVLRYRDKPFDLNANAARLLTDLTMVTGEKRHRAMAERILAILSPQAGRYGVAGAEYALAVNEFFDAPISIVITGRGPNADALRVEALQLPLAKRRVWTIENGARMGPLEFRREANPVAYIVTSRGMSAPMSEPQRLAEVLATLR